MDSWIQFTSLSELTQQANAVAQQHPGAPEDAVQRLEWYVKLLKVSREGQQQLEVQAAKHQAELALLQQQLEVQATKHQAELALHQQQLAKHQADKRVNEKRAEEEIRALGRDAPGMGCTCV